MEKLKNQYPPGLPNRFLKWFLKEELEEEVLGDLEEQYSTMLMTRNKRSADLNYCFQVLNYMRPFAIKDSLFSNFIPFTMFRSNIKIAWRQLLKHKLFSAINIAGMTMGMSCFILIAFYIQFELSFDQSHKHADNIYRLVQFQQGNVFRGSQMFAYAPATIGPALIQDFPEVEASTTLAPMPFVFLKDEEPIFESGLFAQPSLFDVFSYPAIEGDPLLALEDKESIILTESLARKYFGYDSPIGKQMKLSQEKGYTVKAVIKDIPKNHHLRFDFLISIQNYGEYVEDLKEVRWESNNYIEYIRLAEGADPEVVVEKMKMFDDKLIEAYAGLPFRPVFQLEALTRLHLYSKANGDTDAGDIRYIYLAICIGLIILLAALINYMNLASANFKQRFKEVGVRKVLGAKKQQLIDQFMIETLLVSVISFVLALVLANFLLPIFNQYLDVEISLQILDNPWVVISLLALTLFLGFLSGLYPAIMSTSIGPIRALKGIWIRSRTDRNVLRNTLVIAQFTAAIVLAISSVIIFQQLQFIQTKKLGFEREELLFVSYRNQQIFDKAEVLRAELLKIPTVEDVSLTSSLPLNVSSQTIIKEWEGNENNEELYIYRFRVDEHFLDIFQIDLLEGRNFSPDNPGDSTNTYILNEAAVRKLGWSNEDAVGKSFREGKIIGIVKDFHFQPFDFHIEPAFITFYTERISYFAGNIVLKVNTAEHQPLASQAKELIQRFFPSLPFNLRYVDEAYQRLYVTEKRFGEAFNIFTVLALLIACMGLFGLVANSVLQRTKEIGVRKVIGASILDIVRLISKDFLKLVLFASILAVPIGWWAMNRWLEDFAYRIDIDWSVFLLVGIASIIIALLAVGLQSLKAALANPVEAIRSE